MDIILHAFGFLKHVYANIVYFSVKFSIGNGNMFEFYNWQTRKVVFHMRYRPMQAKQMLFDVFDEEWDTQKKLIKYRLEVGVNYTLDLRVQDKVIQVSTSLLLLSR